MSGIAIYRARLRRVRDHARGAVRIACAVAQSTGHFVGGCAVVAGSGLAAWHFLGDVRQPDAVLLHRAIDQARAAVAAAVAVHPSALTERDRALFLVAVAIFFGGAGVVWLVDWWQSLPCMRKQVTTWIRKPLDTDTE